jgi:intein/homing endonuclease
MKFSLERVSKMEQSLSESETVYDFEVEGDHSYTVDNIAVHNSCCTTRVKTGK